MTIGDALIFGYTKLSAYSLSPQLDAEVLLAHALHREKTALFTHPEFTLSSSREKTYRTFIKRAEQQEPIAYIASSKEFFGIAFLVNKHVLIPRSASETMVECVLDLAKNIPGKNCSILDIGTGSGCIIISLAQNLPSKNYSCYGIDISRRALSVAKQNARAHGLHTHISFMQSNLLQNTADMRLEHNIIITANLPYISPEKYQKLAPCIKNFEPQKALLSEQGGLAHYTRLLRQIKTAQNVRNKTVSLFMELEPEQIPALTAVITSLWNRPCLRVIKDANGNERVLLLKIHV